MARSAEGRLCDSCHDRWTRALLPWTRPGGARARAIFAAVWALTAHPIATPARLPRHGGTRRALIFALGAWLLLVVVGASHLRFVFDVAQTMGEAITSASALAAVGLLAWVGVLATVEWLLLLLIRPEPGRFERQLRVACYSLAPLAVVAVLPVAGCLVGVVWAFAVRVAGTRSLQAVGWFEATVVTVFAVTIPLAAAAALRLDVYLPSF